MEAIPPQNPLGEVGIRLLDTSETQEHNMTPIEKLIRHAMKVRRQHKPHCWLFRYETAWDILDYYNRKSLGKMFDPERADGMIFLGLPIHVVRTSLQYEAVLYYLTEVKGLRVAIRKEEKP